MLNFMYFIPCLSLQQGYTKGKQMIGIKTEVKNQHKLTLLSTKNKEHVLKTKFRPNIIFSTTKIVVNHCKLTKIL